MGLSGRKVKQRIPDDPRNLSWADNAARFGSSYLAKFGWDSSKGLGATGEGMTSHIKVSHKLDMLGIGAAHQKDPNGIAWKQNKDFENLLRRLNENKSQEPDSTEEGSAEVQGDASDEVCPEEEENQDGEDGKKKKRKRNKHGEDGAEKEDKDRTKKRKKSNEGNDEHIVPAEVVETVSVIPAKRKTPLIPRHRAHRARAIAAKSIAFKSAASISEILGIAPSSSSGLSSGAETPQGKLTPLDDDVQIEKITTSTKSVADYFKEKLLAKSGSKSYTPTTVVSETDMSIEETASYELPRGGLGTSRLRVEQTFDTESQRIGLSKFSSLRSSSFLAATSSFSATVESTITETVEAGLSEGDVNWEKTKEKLSEGDNLDKEERRRRKKEKKERKEAKEQTRRETESKARRGADKEGSEENREDEEGEKKERTSESTDKQKSRRTREKEEKRARKEKKKRVSVDE